MIALQHCMETKLDSTPYDFVIYEHRDGWEMQVLLQHTTTCGPIKITVD